LTVVDKLKIKEKLFSAGIAEMDKCMAKECKTGGDKNTFYSTMCNLSLKSTQQTFHKNLQAYVNKRVLKKIQEVNQLAKKSRRLLGAKVVVAKPAVTAEGKKREAKDTKNSYCAHERTRSVKICKRVGEFANNVIRKLNMRIPLINCMGKTF